MGFSSFPTDLFQVHNFLQVLCIVLLSFLCIEHFSKKWNFKTITKKIPTIYGLPFLGISYRFLPLKRFLYEITDGFIKLKSPTFFTWLGTNPFLITIDPEVVKTILTSDEFRLKARSIYVSIENALPGGIMTSNGAKWKQHRKLMNLSFSTQVLKKLLPIFNKGALKITKNFNDLVDSKEHDVFDIIKRTVLQTSIETTMGIELKEGNHLDEEVAKGFNFMLHEVAREMFFNSVRLGFLIHTRKYYRTIKLLRDYAANLINIKYASRQPVMESVEIYNNNEETHDEIFLKQAISYQKRGLFESEDVISETHTVIAGTFDTVTTTIYSLIVLLAMHPDIQEKLYMEICSAIPFSGDDIDYEQTKQVPYMDMVIDEALRLMPSIPVIGRQTVKDVNISEDVTLPKDMEVMIPIFSLHRCKDIWGPNADAFDPDNFLPEKASKRHPFAYIPFSKGGRNCLGLRYANIALRVHLLMLVRNFKFSTSFKYEDLVFVDYVSLRYDVEPKIEIERRSVG